VHVFGERKYQLIIGSNAGLSGNALACHKGITVGNNAKFGGNVCIFAAGFYLWNPSYC
jgi:hypothetical protein